MNVLDKLACEVVSYTSRRPWLDVDPWNLQALYFNANGTDPRFEAEHELVAAECERRRVDFCLWFNVPRDQQSMSAGATFAVNASAKVTLYGGSSRVKAVMFDNEKVPLNFQAGYINRWDALRPFRPTLYSVEPFQNSTQNAYGAMLDRNAAGHGRVRKITGQCYNGGMVPLKPADVRDYLRMNVPLDTDFCPTVDPAQPAKYLTQVATTGSVGAMLFESGRIPPS